MNIKDLIKVGSVITLEKDRQFRVLNIRKDNNRNYLFCCTNKKPILPVIFEYIIVDGQLRVKEEKDNEILTKIYKKLIEENS